MHAKVAYIDTLSPIRVRSRGHRRPGWNATESVFSPAGNDDRSTGSAPFGFDIEHLDAGGVVIGGGAHPSDFARSFIGIYGY